MSTKAKSTRRSQETHTIECKFCGVEKLAPIETTGYTCWQCVIEQYWSPADAPKKKSVGYPKGWRFMKEFVHENGTVYRKGEEQPDLKGTLQPTPLSIKEPKAKKSKVQKAQEKQEALARYSKLKKDLVKEVRVTYRKKIEIELKKLQKLI
jgi:hypothetical protein